MSLKRQSERPRSVVQQIGASAVAGGRRTLSAGGWLAVALIAGCNKPSQPSGNTAIERAQTSVDKAKTAAISSSPSSPADAQGTGGAGSPSPDRRRQLAQATAFIDRPEQQHAIETAFRARASTHPAYCPAATFVPKRIDIAYDPAPDFAGDGTMTRGTVVYRATMRSCAIPLLLTVYVDAMPGMPLRFRVTVPGTSFADADLQERAVPQALAAARALLGTCAQLRPIDTRLIGTSPGAGGTLTPWSEYWLVAGCGRMVSTKLDFTPDPVAKQMIVRADPSATRPLDPAGVLSPSATPAAPSASQVASTGAGGRIVATATATSVIPLGGAEVPAAKVAGTCQFKLREQAPATAPDGVECLSGLAARPGATSTCTATRGAAKGQLIAAVTSVGRPSGSMTFSCTVRAP